MPSRMSDLPYFEAKRRYPGTRLHYPRRPCPDGKVGWRRISVATFLRHLPERSPGANGKRELWATQFKSTRRVDVQYDVIKGEATGAVDIYFMHFDTLAEFCAFVNRHLAGVRIRTTIGERPHDY